MGLQGSNFTLGNGTIDAFNYFPTPAQIAEPPQDESKRLICGFNLGTQTASISNGSSPSGGTGCGLYPILRYFMLTVPGYPVYGINPPFDFTFCQPADQSTFIEPVFVIKSQNALINYLNEVNNNINLSMYGFDPTRSVGSQQNFNSSLYNFNFNYLFFGSYTGKENVDPTSVGNPALVEGDLLGNGITGAFGFSSITGDMVSLDNIGASDGAASRAGLELFALLNYLKYGGIAIVAGNWKDLYKAKDGVRYPDSSGVPKDNEGLPAIIGNKGIDCFVTLEGGSMLTGVNNTSNSTNDAMIYGGAYYAGAAGAGLTYNLTQGLLPENLGNAFAGNGFRGNVFSSILAKIEEPEYFTVFHAGLSGTSFGYRHEFTDIPASAGVFRHPSTDGLSFVYRREATSGSYNTNPGTTNGILDANSINALCCVGGRKLFKTWWTKTGVAASGTDVVGGGVDGSYWVPLLDVVDFAGSLQLALNAKSTQYTMVSNVGGSNQTPVTLQNSAQSFSGTRYPPNSQEILNILGAKRINMMSDETFFATDYVGSTGSIQNTTLANRRYVQSIKGFTYQTAKTILQNLVGTNVKNDNATRSTAISNVTDAFNSANLNSYLRSNYVIQCDNLNNTDSDPTLNMRITIAPVVYIVGGSINAATLTSFNINITIV